MAVKTGKNYIQDNDSSAPSYTNNPYDNSASLKFAWTQEIFDLATCILVVLAPDQTIVRINKRGCEILGYEACEMVGKNWFDTFLPERNRNKTRKFFAQLIAGDVTPSEYYENPIVTRAGEERQIRWHNVIMRKREGSILFTISSGEDITGQRTMEAALRESERNAYVLLNATFDAVFLVETSFKRVLAANDQFARRFNTTVDQVLGRSIEDFVPQHLFPQRYSWA
ncbi:MAG: PAS domain S-box protein, partial [Syntrophaceae bacterium]|nr:PAS domain S-box protein [Syntrophaceae bacterium]